MEELRLDWRGILGVLALAALLVLSVGSVNVARADDSEALMCSADDPKPVSLPAARARVRKAAKPSDVVSLNTRGLNHRTAEVNELIALQRELEPQPRPPRN